VLGSLTRFMFAVYRLKLRDPARPPSGVIAQLRDELPDVKIGASGQALIFMAEDPRLGARVRSTVERICGDGDWRKHFGSLANAPEFSA
jgi:hypothetical protein